MASCFLFTQFQCQGSLPFRLAPLVDRVVIDLRLLGARLGEWGMVNRPAPPLPLRAGDREELSPWLRSSPMPAGVV